MTESQQDVSTSLIQQIKIACQALDDKKAENIKVLYLGKKSSIADYFVIASGTSAPHLRALGSALDKSLSDMGVDCTMDTASNEVAWTVVDAYDCIYHIFTPETREFYGLESLWKDAEVFTPEELVED